MVAPISFGTGIKMKVLDALAHGLPLVATNDVHFGRADMYEAHDALMCIADGTYVSQTDRRKLTREHGALLIETESGSVRIISGELRWT